MSYPAYYGAKEVGSAVWQRFGKYIIGGLIGVGATAVTIGALNNVRSSTSQQQGGQATPVISAEVMNSLIGMMMSMMVLVMMMNMMKGMVSGVGG